MISETAIWTIFLLPLSSFVIIALVIRPFFNRYSFLSGLILITFLAAAFGLSIWTLQSVIEGHEFNFPTYHWLEIGGASIELGLLVDPVTAIMLVVVTGVSLMVQIYSQGYMLHDPGYSRYFAYMSLFTAAMLGLVLSVNIVQLYAFWELVGLSSYLLIGFWYDRPSAAAAAKKAFIITRIGDVGFLLAILYLFFRADDFSAAGLNAFHIPHIWEAVTPLASGAVILGGASLTWLTLGIFAGAAGKSGQFPLHTWLPDAMEGPTPVSALIHAATMVAAGVFLVARFFPLFQESQDAMAVVALIGAFTAFMAATMGLVMNDIKRVMAYSTISQLGYMMAALGVGAYAPALFHLFAHAFFKALLFLGAGSVNHVSGTFNMRYMGGLRRWMPWTYALTLIASLSLVGIIPLSGFWSKDEILLGAWEGSALVNDRVSQLVFLMLISGVFLTAFYTFRMIYLTFHGEFRGGVDRELADQSHQPAHRADTGAAYPAGHDAGSAQHGGVHLAESPAVMVFPMLILGIAAAVVGYVANPQADLLGIPKHWITEFFAHGLEAAVPEIDLELHDFDLVMGVVSTVVALAGIALAILAYRGQRERVDEPLERLGPLHTLLSQKYYMDVLYESLVVRRLFYWGIAGTLDWLDRNLVDGFVDFTGWVSRNIGFVMARFQTGQVQGYAVVLIMGSVLILAGYLVFG